MSVVSIGLRTENRRLITVYLGSPMTICQPEVLAWFYIRFLMKSGVNVFRYVARIVK